MPLLLQQFALYLPLETKAEYERGPVIALNVPPFTANITRLSLISNTIMKNEYIDLFKERKWKEALGAMPLNIPKVITVESANDLNILRVRATDFGKENNRKVSVSLNYDKKQAIVTVRKR